MTKGLSLDGWMVSGALRASWGAGSGPGSAAGALDDLFDAAEAARDDRERAFSLARDVAAAIPRPAQGRTLRYLETLATLGAADVTVARIVEPHVDAAMILAECPDEVDLAAIGATHASTWGVFAAEGPGEPLRAIPDAGGWTLRGTKPWCSLAGELSHALVTARVGSEADAARGLFAVALRQEGVHAHPESWVARGFPTIPSGPTDFDGVRAVPVGQPGWYLERAGFEWGGIGVAACWFGGAVGVARRVVAAAQKRGDDIGYLHAGRVAASVSAAGSALASAARAIDAAADVAAPTTRGVPSATDPAGAVAALPAGRRAFVIDAAAAAAPPAARVTSVVEAATDSAEAPAPAAREREAAAALDATERALLAQVTRSVVRRECEAILAEAASALGPAPLALDERYAARVADLELYLRQDHGARDELRAGRLLTGGAA
ncbi:MAG: acyl-CoA dehydrogenase [Herbiconiux sp.]|uniref:acyl-CoA dehydrogenase n=1 Tax=Herbiconiux sp. TaxID=1871186 RepID=UPI0012022193|nr:acyl-CoA dehydrogenase [Herbiconiux sp.]TAJ47927.1 MAG: acyl-CoA dehydrogenase [Herbiconiux sp.]